MRRPLRFSLSLFIFIFIVLLLAHFSPISAQTSNNYLYLNGNVGVGTNNPSTTNGSVGRLLNIETSGGSGALNAVLVGSQASSASPGSPLILEGRVDNVTSGDSRVGQIQLLNDNGVTAGLSGDISLLTNNGGSLTEKMRITNTGNVGIGSNNPNSKLQVTGQIGFGSGSAFLNSTAQDNFQLMTNTNTPNPNFTIGIGNGLGSFSTTPISWNAGYLTLSGNKTGVWCPSCGGGVTPDIVIQPGGQVGINTTSANSLLQVGGGGDGWANGLTIYSSYPTIYFRNSQGNTSGMIHVNSNLMYFLSGCGGNDPNGGNNWCTKGPNNAWPLQLNLTNSNAVFGGSVSAGNLGYSYDDGGEVQAKHFHNTNDDTWIPYPGDNFNYLRGSGTRICDNGCVTYIGSNLSVFDGAGRLGIRGGINDWPRYLDIHVDANSPEGAWLEDNGGRSVGIFPSLQNQSYNPITQTYDAGLFFGGQGGFVIAPWTGGASGMRMNSGGYVTFYSGTNSSKSVKGNFTSINEQDILSKIDNLPIMEWNYITDTSSRHIGPFSEDFDSLFGVNGKHTGGINPTDEPGIALAGIKGLIEKDKALETQNGIFKQQLTNQQAEIDQLKSSVEALKSRN